MTIKCYIAYTSMKEKKASLYRLLSTVYNLPYLVLYFNCVTCSLQILLKDIFCLCKNSFRVCSRNVLRKRIMHPKYLICNEWVVSFDFVIVCPFRLTKVHWGPLPFYIFWTRCKTVALSQSNVCSWLCVRNFTVFTWNSETLVKQ